MACLFFKVENDYVDIVCFRQLVLCGVQLKQKVRGIYMCMCAPQYVLFGSVSSDGSGVLLFLDDFDSGVFFHWQYLIYKTNVCS